MRSRDYPLGAALEAEAQGYQGITVEGVGPGDVDHDLRVEAAVDLRQCLVEVAQVLVVAGSRGQACALRQRQGGGDCILSPWPCSVAFSGQSSQFSRRARRRAKAPSAVTRVRP